MKLRKVFSIYGNKISMPSDAQDACMLLNGQCMGNGNGGYIDFDVVANPTKDEQGYGYVEDGTLRQLTTWLLDQGAELGDSVLIEVSW